jgi:hypothetical protein
VDVSIVGAVAQPSSAFAGPFGSSGISDRSPARRRTTESDRGYRPHRDRPRSASDLAVQTIHIHGCMRPAFNSGTKGRGATALGLFCLTPSDTWHSFGDQKRFSSALDRDCAGNCCQDIEWDERLWHDRAPSVLSPSCTGRPRSSWLFRTMSNACVAEPAGKDI